MPFLIPALLALASDVAVLCLNRMGKKQQQQQQGSVMDDLASMVLPPDSDDPDTAEVYFWIGYLGPLAGLRIVLLLLPLLFHSYTGTAVRFPKLYQFLYISTLAVLMLHMLGLILMNPQSLESILPWEAIFTLHKEDDRSETSNRHLLQHLHALRRIWWMLFFSAISNSCHLFLLQHVKSTAPETAQPQSVYFAIRSRITPDGVEEPALVNAVNDFLVDVQVRMRRTKQEWTQRLDDFTRNRRGPEKASVHGTIGNRHNHNAPFRVLLQLFADQDVISNGRLSAAFDFDNGQSMTILVPQLLSFLLHGATTCSRDLEEWILQKCSENVYFAHRCYWFLRAWCLEVPGDPTATAALSRSNSDSQLGSLVEQEGHRRLLSGYNSGYTVIQTLQQQAPESATSTTDALAKFMPQERAMIENLMLRVKECGEKAARLLESGAKSGEAPAHSGMSPSLLMQVVEQGGIPIDPTTGRPSQRHLDSLAAPQLHGFTVPAEESNNPPPEDSTEKFDKTPQFLDALIYIAEWLHTVDRAQRKDELHNMLRQLECELLPDNGVYVPGVPGARVWRIAVQECIPISTKERVPCILPLELVQWDKQIDTGLTNNKNPRMSQDDTGLGAGSNHNNTGWSLLDLPKTFSMSTANNSTGRSSTATAGDNSVYFSANESMHPAEPEASVNHGAFAGYSSLRQRGVPELSEADIVKDWTTRPRNPHRLVPLINKVAESMKGTVDRVKTSVQERIIEPLQQRTSNMVVPLEELKSLTGFGDLQTSDDVEIDEDGDMFVSADVIPMTSDQKDVESGRLSPIVTPVVAPGMGQWSSPVVTPTSRKQVRTSLNPLPAIRRRPEMKPPKPGPYGTTREGDADESDNNDKPRLDANIPRSDGSVSTVATTSSARPPPVVFKESWQVKQERIRQNSAYGNHPGWQLFPILIKANDDLRQEELASQLIYRMASILAREKVTVWLCPYEIIALTNRGGIMQAIPDTISIDSLKKNDPNYTTLRDFFHHHFVEGSPELSNAKANFVESLAAYSMVCFLLQIKDRHNGNILIDRTGHVIHIDFGFFFLSSPGKNAGFESAPFKLTRDFIQVMDGPHSHLFHIFRELCVRSFLALRKHCLEILMLVEMLQLGNEQLGCFRGRPAQAVAELRSRFRLDLNDRACREYVQSLIDDSMENWRTDWYDRYQKYFVGVL